MANQLFSYAKLTLLAALVVLVQACAASANGSPAAVETLTINEPLANSPTATVTLALDGGSFNLSGGSDNLAQGTIRYNNPAWKPALTRTAAALTIEQTSRGPSAGLLAPNDVNNWNLNLGRMPLDLNLRVRNYTGNINLSGMRLRNVSIIDGSSTSRVQFNRVNPEPMALLAYSSGASTATLSGLANANFANMRFRGVGGNYTLDFSGDLQRDAAAEILSGLGSLTIEIPAKTAAQVTLHGNLRGLVVEGDWLINENVYSTGGAGHMLTLNVAVDLGTMTLVRK